MRNKSEQNVTNLESNEQVQAIFKAELLNKFNYDLPNDRHPKLIYDQLSKERELFIFSFRKYYDFSKGWRYGVIIEDSFNRLLFQAQNKSNPNKNVGIKQFNDLITKPNAMDKEDLTRALNVLCQIDAYTTLELIFKKNPKLPVDLSQLLSVAIASLNLATVKTLIGLGADLHKPLLYLHDTDNGFNCFCSPLYYAIVLPANPQSSIGRFGPILKPDHPKLLNIIQYLLTNGANPEQKCILTHCNVFNLEESENQVDADDGNVDCKKLAQTFLDNPKSKDLSSEYRDTLMDIINWTSPVSSLAHSL